MDLKIVEARKMKSLEEYSMALVLGLISLQTLDSYHVRAIELGILKEDMACQANTIAWDLRRAMKQYRDQLESVLDLLPEDFDYQQIITNLQAHEKVKTKQVIRKKRIKTDAKELRSSEI